MWGRVVVFVVLVARGIAAASCDPSVPIGPDGPRLGAPLSNFNECGWEARQRNFNLYLDTNACANGEICDLGGGSSLAGGPIGTVLYVGPGCTTSPYCLTDGVSTSGNDLFVWEGTTVDASEFRVSLPSDPTNDIVWSQPNCGALCTVTFPSATGTLARTSGDTLSSTTLSSPTISSPTITSPTTNTGVSNGTGIKHGRVTTGSISSSSSAAVTLTWGGSAFANTSYTTACQVLEATTSTNTVRVHHIESQSTTTVVVRVVNDDAGGAHTGTLHCIAMHD